MPGPPPQDLHPTHPSKLTTRPGWSLWLVPDADSPINAYLTTTIHSRMPRLFPDAAPVPKFWPHVTLTSHIDPASVPADARGWLAALPLQLPPSSGRDVRVRVRVRFRELDAGAPFFKKLFLRCERDEGLLALAQRCRELAVLHGDAEAAAAWVDAEYDPHCSLMYAECEVGPEEKLAVERAIAGVKLMRREAGEEEDGAVEGWVGGKVQLVATGDTGVEGWKVIAERAI